MRVSSGSGTPVQLFVMPQPSTQAIRGSCAARGSASSSSASSCGRRAPSSGSDQVTPARSGVTPCDAAVFVDPEVVRPVAVSASCGARERSRGSAASNGSQLGNLHLRRRERLGHVIVRAQPKSIHAAAGLLKLLCQACLLVGMIASVCASAVKGRRFAAGCVRPWRAARVGRAWARSGGQGDTGGGALHVACHAAVDDV